MVNQERSPAGNIYDKYGTKNFIARQLIAGFFRQFDFYINEIHPHKLLEVGCGEGYVLQRMNDILPACHTTGIDISFGILHKAREICEKGLYACASVYNLPFEASEYDLVLCIEVLEHLTDPHAALEEISRLASNYVLISVPLEPIWRVLNLLRGAYIRRFGNTPGHVNHWNKKSLVELLGKYFQVIEVSIPFPWIMALCKAQLSNETRFVK